MNPAQRPNAFRLVDKSCHRRRAEAAQIRQFFQVNGWIESASEARADCVILLTCAEMRYKVVNMVREVAALAARLDPRTSFIVGSCLPRTDPAALARVFSGPTLTPTDFTALDALPGITVPMGALPPLFGPAAAFAPGCRERRHRPWRRLRSGAPSRGRLHRSRRQAIHVSAGCAMACTYCAIRFATGRIRSKPVETVLRTIQDGLRRGYRSFDLLADSIGGYGLDLGTGLDALLEGLLALPGTFTLGISDLHPQAFLDCFAGILALCQAGRMHYLYVPIQTGNARVLRAMNRPCDLAVLRARFLQLRGVPGLFMQTGIIIGFPGETEAEFQDTLAFLEAVGFDGTYVHYYCDMPNTPASRMPLKVGKAVMAQRLEQASRSAIHYNHAKTALEWDSTLALS